MAPAVPKKLRRLRGFHPGGEQTGRTKTLLALLEDSVLGKCFPGPGVVSLFGFRASLLSAPRRPGHPGRAGPTHCIHRDICVWLGDIDSKYPRDVTSLQSTGYGKSRLEHEVHSPLSPLRRLWAGRHLGGCLHDHRIDTCDRVPVRFPLDPGDRAPPLRSPLPVPSALATNIQEVAL
jgi:hypothetical protein